MKRISFLLLTTFLVSILFSNCATIFSKSEYPLNLKSTPEANVIVKDENGTEVYKGVTPVEIILKTKSDFFKGKNYTITFSQEGYADNTMLIDTNLDNWYFGNICFGGVIGMLIVDPITGAMWKLSARELETNLQKLSADVQEHNVLKIMTLDQVPNHLRSKLEPIR